MLSLDAGARRMESILTDTSAATQADAAFMPTPFVDVRSPADFPDSPASRVLAQPLMLGLFLPIQAGGWSASTLPRTTDWTFDYNAALVARAEALGFDLVFALSQWLPKGGYGGGERRDRVEQIDQRAAEAAAFDRNPQHAERRAAKQLEAFERQFAARLALRGVAPDLGHEFRQCGKRGTQRLARFGAMTGIHSAVPLPGITTAHARLR
jgi:hypothetical protein